MNLRRSTAGMFARVWLLAVAIFALAAGGVSRAQDVGDLGTTVSESVGLESSILGLGVGAAPDYEGSNEYKAVPLVQARLNFEKGYYISLFGNSLRANVVPSKNWHLGPMVRYRAERDDVKDDEIDNFEKVDAATEVGLFASYSGEHLIAVLSGTKDVSASYSGYLGELGLGYKIPLSRGALTLFAMTTYADSEYMETYFDVTPANSIRSGLPTYEAESGFKDASAGFAWQHNLNDNWGLLTVARYSRLLEDAEDSPVVDEEGDANQYFAGFLVNYRFAAKKPAEDSDGDGVPDDRDKCPGTPKGVKVDSNGCPLDSDGDGVPDYLDKCPGTPKGVKVDSNGCPLDSDGDGVPDYLDKCPDTPKGAPVDKNGCPLDSDGDGVPDYLDKCPGTPKGTLVDETGCELKLTLHINFDFDKAEIKPEFEPEMEKAAKFIQEHASVPFILIAGHTDSMGEEAYNQELSDKRAAAVRQHLVEHHGIKADKLKARGYGEARPVADNATEEGRYENRRVEVLCCAVIPE
ncbi:MAG TPA: MipA/OmpV family protein [Desulfuromonadales bacterium]